MNSASQIWSCVIEILRKELTDVAIETWFMDCDAVDIKEDRFFLCVPVDFKRDTVNKRFKSMIEDALKEIFATDFEVMLLSKEETARYGRSVSEDKPGLLDGDNYTFSNFVVGPSNKFAHAAALAVAEERTTAYNPLFIYGESGLGKTHLLCAIRHEARIKHPDWNIIYVKGEDFTNALVESIRSGKTAEFREKYRAANLFLMDDVQFIAGKIQTQEEFFYTFSALYESNRQIVFTSDRPPAEINLLMDRLKTRFESGLLADVQKPSYETSLAIIQTKLQQMGTIIPEECSKYIADNMRSNVRQIEGSVKKLIAWRDLTGEQLTAAKAEEILKTSFKEDKNSLTYDLIIDETAKFYSLTQDEIKGQSRSKNTVTARHVAVYLIRDMTNLSLKEIGDIFDGRDHSTILNSVRYVEKNIEQSSEFSQTVKDIKANINAKC